MLAGARVGLLALIALIGLLGGFAAYRLLTPRTRATLSVDTAAAPPELRAAARATQVAQSLPSVSLPDLGGQPVSLQSFLGQPLIVNFWATWCEPCRREMPLLSHIQHRFATDQLRIVGIAVDFPKAVQDYLVQHPVDYPVLIGEKGGLTALTALGMQAALPVSVFADAQGRIVATKLGELHADEADYIVLQLQALGRAQLTLPQARENITQRLQALAVQRAKADASGS